MCRPPSERRDRCSEKGNKHCDTAVWWLFYFGLCVDRQQWIDRDRRINQSLHQKRPRCYLLEGWTTQHNKAPAGGVKTSPQKIMLFDAFNKTHLNLLYVLLYYFPENKHNLQQHINYLKRDIQTSERKAYENFKTQIQDCVRKTGLSESECINRLLQQDYNVCNSVRWLSEVCFTDMMSCRMSNRKKKKIVHAFVNFIKAYSVINICKSQTDRIGALAGDIAQQEDIQNLRSNPTALLSAVVNIMGERKAEVEEIFDEIIQETEEEADGKGDGSQGEGGGVEGKVESKQTRGAEEKQLDASSLTDFMSPQMKNQLQVLLHNPDSSQQIDLNQVLDGMNGLLSQNQSLVE